MVMLFFLHTLKVQDAFETFFDKIEQKLKTMKEAGTLQSRPFAFDYFMVLLWEYK